MTPTLPLPAARPVDVVPVRQPDGEMAFIISDPLRIAPQQLAMSFAGYFALAHLDGSRSAAEIQQAFRAHFALAPPIEEIVRLVEVLDHYALLNNQRFTDEYARRREAFRAAPTRDNRDRWPEGQVLRAEIEAMLAGAETAAPGSPAIRGLIAPHLDYARGAPCYAAAYAALRTGGLADRYCILGTNHFGVSSAVVAAGKDFETPLGRVATDRRTLQCISAALGYDLTQHEFDHAIEHSVELQVHILQVLHAGRPFEIIPILCPDPCGPSGTRPRDGVGPDLRDFAVALAAACRAAPGRTVIIAGADLSHVGQRFGDEQSTTPAFLKQIAERDQALLELVREGKSEEFVASVVARDNDTRICSVGCIFALLRALGNPPTTVLTYHQAADIPAETTVSCCAAVIV